MTLLNYSKQTLQAVPGYLRVYRTLRKGLLYAHKPDLFREEMQLTRDYLVTREQLGPIIREANHTPWNRLAVFVSFTNVPLWSKFHGLLALSLRLKGYRPVVLNNSGSRWAEKFFRAFGIGGAIGDLVKWDHLVKELSPSREELQREVAALVPNSLSVQSIKNLFFHDVAVGRQALSQTVRNLNQGRVELSDPRVAAVFSEQLMLAVQSIYVAEKWLEEHRPALMIVRDPAYIPNGAIYEVACLRGVDTIRCELGQRMHTWIFKRHTPEERWNRHISISPSTWERLRSLTWSGKHERELNTEFSERYRPDSRFDMRRIQAGKRDKGVDEVRKQIGLDPQKKTAVVFSHVAFDAAFFYGEDLFEDLEEWFIETARAACENQSLNWILKLHPGNLVKLAHSGITEETEMAALRRLGPLPGHVKVLRANTDINTQSLVPLIDYGLTVRGSVGFELPCFGIPCLTGGTGAYSGYGFTYDSDSREEYFQRLQTLHETPRLSSEQIKLAKKHAYYLLVSRQTSFEDVAPISVGRLETAKHQKRNFWNLRLNISTANELIEKPSIRAFLEWATNCEGPDLMVH